MTDTEIEDQFNTHLETLNGQIKQLREELDTLQQTFKEELYGCVLELSERISSLEEQVYSQP